MKFHYHPSPNPAKVALFLEEAGLPYERAPVDVQRGEQHAPACLAINPNGKTPAIVDGNGPSSTAMRSCCTWPSRRGNSRADRNRAANCCPG